IVGSNIANVGLILGLSAMILPLLVNSSVVKRELPVMLLASAMTAGLAIYPFGSGEHGRGLLTRADGVILLVGFVITMWLSFRSVRSPDSDGSDITAEIQELREATKDQPIWRGLVFIALGLGALVAGGQLSEAAASTIAAAMGMSDEMIGLTV